MKLLSFLFLLCFCPYYDAMWNAFDLAGVYKINSLNGNGPILTQNFSQFGSAISYIGDLDNDGIADLAVGAKGESVNPYDTTGNLHQGAIYILFMSKTGIVKKYTRISHLSNGGPPLISKDQFGSSICNIGDLNGDNITDLAVGAPGYILGAVYILFMQRDGTVSSYRLIRGKYSSQSSPIAYRPPPNSTYSINGPPISYSDAFGQAITSIGDFNHDGIPDIAVGAPDKSVGNEKVWLLYLDRLGTVLNYTEIGELGTKGNGPPIAAYAGFGVSLQALQDKDGDGVIELAVGANLYRDTPESKVNSGAIFILFLSAAGIVKYFTYFGQLHENKVAGGGKKGYNLLPLSEYDSCGSSLTSIGDINVDSKRQWHFSDSKDPGRQNIQDLVTGCTQIVTSPGKLYLLFMTGSHLSNGYEQTYTQIPGFGNTGGKLGRLLSPGDQFGASMSRYSDIDATGIMDLVVGAPGDHQNGITSSGAIYILSLQRNIILKYRAYNYLPLVLGLGLGLLMALLIALFCWLFRRKANIVEIAADVVGVEIEPVEQPKKKKKKKTGHSMPEEKLEYCDHYEL